MNLKTFRTLVAIFIKLIISKATKKRIPIFVSLQITKMCNLRCSYCFADLDSLRSIPDFTTAEWKEIIDELYKLGTRWIRIQGGEPLIRDDIGELIDYVKDVGMICELVTNGLLTKQRLEDLKHLDSLCISLDGDREANDMIRGKGVYDRVVESIRLAKSYGLRIRIHGVLTRYTVNSLENIAELCRDIGVQFNIAYYSLDGDKEANGIDLSCKDLKEYYKRYLLLKKDGYPIASSYTYINHILNWPKEMDLTLYRKDFKLLRKLKLIHCLAGRTACFVDSDGGLYACPKRWKKGINISQGIQKAWDAIKDLDCISCWAYGDNDAYAIMDLNLPALWNVFTYLMPFTKSFR